MTQTAGQQIDPQELIKLIQENPEVKQALLQTVKNRKRKKPATSNAAGTEQDAPETETELTDANAAQMQKLMLEAIQQIERNSAEQKRTAANIYRSVQTTQALAKEIRTVKRIGSDVREIGEVAVLAIALTSAGLFVIVCTAIVLKNAITDAIGGINPFSGESNSTSAQVVNMDFPGIYDGGEVAGIPVTSNFGMRVHPITGVEKMHEGADLGMDSGTALHAPAAGIVECKEDPPGYGTYAEMGLPNGDSILLGHLSECFAGPAQPGKQIATSGNTGASTEPHLHLELLKGGKPVQPTIDVALGVIVGVDYMKVRELTAKYYQATVHQESGGEHTAQNTRTAATGLTQIMPDNIPSWSKEALGNAVSVDEFLASPDLQKSISLYRMATNVAQQLKEANGDDRTALRRVAALWYSGNPARENDYSALPFPGEPSVGDYVDSVMSKIDGAAGADVPPPVQPPSAKEERERAEQFLQQSPKVADPDRFTVEVWINTDSGIAPASGIIIRSDGLILTNHHVIANGLLHVKTKDGKQFSGRTIASDSSLDLALVQLDGAANLPTAPLAQSANVKAGDTVRAIGHPMGSHWKQTEASVIVVNSDCGLQALDGNCIRTPSGFLYPGNSGGPLLNDRGEVIGINRAIQESTGEGVSIPIEIFHQQFKMP
ncbi:trypsin-like peptidase domain-containing protein [Leptolyngbya sp. GB1-A1]|uniref:trypsin-like peptidase domain-containing protein n=1 Tax=Leptolyngbya sp. GB1-A1 TaxID=2933908 RepID=UPI00329849D5